MVADHTIHSVWIALAVTSAFAVLAWLLRGVSPSGAVAGGVISFLLYISAGPGAFAALITVFALTWLTTRIGYQRKTRLGVAEKREGRKASQVLANLGVSAGCGLLYAWSSQPAYLVAAAAALSEAAADTVSSELGQASSRTARLVTTWERVPAGTDGAISLPGTVGGLTAASLVSLVCMATGLLSPRSMVLAVLAAIAGTVMDSFLGASLESRRIINNDLVNFLSTFTAGVIAFLLT